MICKRYTSMQTNLCKNDIHLLLIHSNGCSLGCSQLLESSLDRSASLWASFWIVGTWRTLSSATFPWWVLVQLPFNALEKVVDRDSNTYQPNDHLSYNECHSFCPMFLDKKYFFPFSTSLLGEWSFHFSSYLVDTIFLCKSFFFHHLATQWLFNPQNVHGYAYHKHCAICPFFS